MPRAEELMIESKSDEKKNDQIQNSRLFYYLIMP